MINPNKKRDGVISILDREQEIFNKIFPGLCEYINDELFFCDKNITPLPLKVQLRSTVYGYYLKFKWGRSFDMSENIMELYKYQDREPWGMIILSFDAKRISDESCIGLYKMNINIGKVSATNMVVINYDREAIQRKWTLNQIINHYE